MSVSEIGNYSADRPSDAALSRWQIFEVGLVGAKYLLPIPVLLIAWELGARFGLINANLFPPPTAIARALSDLASTGMLWRDVSASIIRVSVGFSIAAALGISLGLLLGRLTALARYVLPLVELIRPISVIAWIPIAILWFGLGDKPSWFLIALGAFFPIFTNAYDGARSLAKVYVRVARCFGAPRWLFIRQVLIPATLPHIMTGLRIGLGTGWTCVIAAELISATSGLGYMIQLARTTIETEKVLAGMVVIGLIGFAMNALMLLAERVLLVKEPETN
ncbi:ABC transporter permease [Bradyrhizobium sp. 31Argb]|uniref:ABC transporter permease n=1 Tax=Bradyrhizobium sp. 31Argb TaxID=3141247 RepID=UPI003748A2EE